MSSAGGKPLDVTTLDPATGETNHRWPHFLPDGRHFLYTATTGTCCPPTKPAVIRIGSLDPAEPTTTLFQAESAVSYGSGHLVFAREETLMAQAFNLETRQPTEDLFRSPSTSAEREAVTWARPFPRMALWSTRRAACRRTCS